MPRRSEELPRRPAAPPPELWKPVIAQTQALRAERAPDPVKKAAQPESSPDAPAAMTSPSKLPQALLQFHGDETPEACAAAGRPFLKVARMAPGFDLLDFARRFPKAQGLLLDAHVEAWGGSGKVFDWSLVPRDVPHRLVLSGGLHAGNVAAGIQEVRPWAVDVSSGVESARGVKDAAAIHAFCDAVREADLRIEASVS